MVKRLGGESAGGIDNRNVVDVPNERRASPGKDSATTVAGLSPVKGEMIQSAEMNHQSNISISRF